MKPETVLGFVNVRKKRAGIYQIKNLINNKTYIGSSTNLYKRRLQHFESLKNNLHHNKHLQSAYNKYGKENFIFKVLLICEPTEILYYEQTLLDKLKPEYNKREIAESNVGFRHSDETKLKISITKTGTHLSEEHKRKISENGIGMLGKHHTEETKQKLRLSNLGKKYSNETKERHSIAMKKVWENKRSINK